jgi:large subunit ribosomal protein L4
MATVKIYNLEKKPVGDLELPDSVFGAKVRGYLVHQVIVAQQAGKRGGNHKVKTKAEVRGGGKKPFKQKGTGNARQGSTRSPLNPGGGVAHGPRVRDYWKTVPKKVAKGAMCSVLSDRLASERLIVIDDINLKTPKTKLMSELLLKTFGIDKVLIIDNANKNAELATRNLPKHKFLRTEGANVYDIVRHEWLVLSKQAAVALGERLAK